MSLYDKSSLVLIPSGTKTGTVFSQKPVNGDGDFTFTRASAATRVNADGNIEKETQNQITYSNDFSNSDWAKYLLSSTSGQSGYDGTNDAWLIERSGAFGNVYRNLSISGVFTWSVYAKTGSFDFLCLRFRNASNQYRSAFFDLSTGTLGSVDSNIIKHTIESVGSGWYRCQITFNDSAINQVMIYPSDVNNGIGNAGTGSIYIQDAQLNQGLIAQEVLTTTTAAVYGGITDNTPRLDYTDSSCPALLLEPLRTNLVNYSNSYDFNTTRSIRGSAANRKGVDGFLYSANGSSPNIADSFSPYSQGYQVLSVVIDSANTDYFNIKLATGGNASQGVSATFTPSAKSWSSISENTSFIVSGSGFVDYIDLGDGIFRLIIGADFNNVSSSSFFPVLYFGAGNSNVFIGGIQLEAGSYATSYIPTYGSSVSRVADDTTITNLQSKNIVGNTFSYYFEWGDYVANRNFEIKDSSSFNFLFMVSRLIRYIKQDGSVDSLFILPANGTSLKSLISYDGTTLKGYINGSLAGSVTNAKVDNFSDFDLLRLDRSMDDREELKQVMLFPTALTDQEAIDLTTI